MKPNPVKIFEYNIIYFFLTSQAYGDHLNQNQLQLQLQLQPQPQLQLRLQLQLQLQLPLQLQQLNLPNCHGQTNILCGNVIKT